MTAARRATAAVSAVLPVVIALVVASLALAAPASLPSGLRAAVVIVALAQGLALYWRRRYPRLVIAVTIVGGAIVQIVAPAMLFPYAGLVAMWTLTTEYPPRRTLPALAGLLAVTALSWSTAPPGDTAFAMAVVVAIWAIAEATRSRRVAIEQASRHAAEQEQARLARELHDVLAHSVSVIVVQAAAGDDVFDRDPDAARRVLRSIESTGRDALAELRRLLAAGDAVGGDERRPQPGLDRLDDLADPLRAAGIDVRVTRSGNIGRPLPLGVQLSAYRIVQEALTNAVRHARATQIDVRLDIRAGERSAVLDLSVTDNGRTRPAGPETAGGRGLSGMRQRAALLGGTVEVGPRANGGYRVRAALPIEAAR